MEWVYKKGTRSLKLFLSPPSSFPTPLKKCRLPCPPAKLAIKLVPAEPASSSLPSNSSSSSRHMLCLSRPLLSSPRPPTPTWRCRGLPRCPTHTPLPSRMAPQLVLLHRQMQWQAPPLHRQQPRCRRHQFLSPSSSSTSPPSRASFLLFKTSSPLSILTVASTSRPLRCMREMQNTIPRLVNLYFLTMMHVELLFVRVFYSVSPP